MALLEKLNDSYQSHPDFDSSHRPLSVDDDQVALLNRVWSEFLEGTATPTDSGIREALESIFLPLTEQARDPLLKQFISELREFTVGRFLEDLEFLSPGWSQPAGRLTTDRYYFTKLSPTVVAKILGIMDSFLATARALSLSGETRREFLSANSGVRVWKVVRILNKEFARIGVLDDVSTILPRKARVIGVAVELSVPTSTWWRNSIGDGQGPATMYAHLDESITAPKAIVYLTEVRMENGPTSCFPGIYEELSLSPLQDAVGRVIGKVGNKPNSLLSDAYGKTYHQSMGSPLFRAHFMALPDALRFNAHFGWDVLPSSEIEAQVTGREVVMTGPPGTAIVFDGARLLHRGGLIDSGERIALQVIFGRRTPVETMRLALRYVKTGFTSLLRAGSR